MEITKQSIIGDVLDAYPACADVFTAIGMHCLGCPSARSESIEEAAYVHGENAEELVISLRACIGA